MFSHIAITAANAAQAKGYRAQTARRKDVSVFADPGGRRVGSLGATVNALRRILARPSRPRTLRQPFRPCAPVLMAGLRPARKSVSRTGDRGRVFDGWQP